ncbi:hypothetical protein E1B28_005841 [Marasmius oreades]|uniref:DUF6593 domain-containing protein n=1 Tax=Marasmius oreades TaxID=181124 RepID=A0A9P7S403_9AGAR|nr:uncharacterized protein E1B28_005841 [Marasmius oreades]KAG7095051.1 hypothetical protein E1B28_005841 [Marasmius oreades]
MPFTPDNSFIVRSREYGDGSEFNSSDDTLDIIPDHYVKRLWRRPAVPNVNGGLKDVYINKSPNSRDRSVAFSTVEEGNLFLVSKGDGDEIFMRVEWEGSSLKSMERSSITMDNRTTAIRDFLKASANLLSSSQSRSFVGPDHLEYKWKVVYCGHNPAYPDSRYLELRVKDSKVPIASSARLTARDGAFQDEAHPIYLAERGLQMIPWIVATHALAEKLLNAS